MSFDMRAKPFDLDDNAVRWVNDTFNAMTQEEKIAQLFVDMLWNDTGKQTAALLGRYPSGGLRYNNRKPRELYRQNAAAQKNSRIPLLIAANVEAGGNGAMTGGTKIGEGIACAATGDARSAYEMGLTVAARRRRWAATGRLPQLWILTGTGATVLFLRAVSAAIQTLCWRWPSLT